MVRFCNYLCSFKNSKHNTKQTRMEGIRTSFRLSQNAKGRYWYHWRKLQTNRFCKYGRKISEKLQPLLPELILNSTSDDFTISDCCDATYVLNSTLVISFLISNRGSNYRLFFLSFSPSFTIEFGQSGIYCYQYEPVFHRFKICC